jgi:imidazolonepropionase-like amidohydrolase
MEDRLGTLEKGKDASFIACDGDLLDLRTQVMDMRIEGREVSLASKHTRLHQRYLNRPSPYQKKD